MADHALEPDPQVLSSLLQRLPHALVDLAGNACLFLDRHGDAEVVSARDGQHLELEAELLAQNRRRWVVLLAEESVQFRAHLLDVAPTARRSSTAPATHS